MGPEIQVEGRCCNAWRDICRHLGLYSSIVLACPRGLGWGREVPALYGPQASLSHHRVPTPGARSADLIGEEAQEGAVEVVSMPSVSWLYPARQAICAEHSIAHILLDCSRTFLRSRLAHPFHILKI